MDNILEIIVPLVFAAIYFFGNMLSGKKEEEEQPPPMVPRDAASDENRDDAERQRRVQEEIRRKIMERRRAQSDDAPAPQLSRERTRPREEPAKAAPEPAYRQVAQQQNQPDGIFSWDSSDNAYDKDMQARLRQIEETKRRGERLKRQADTAHMKNEIGSNGQKRNKRRSGGYFSGPVRESLADPAAARVAFIYGEVLGRPVGLRDTSASNVPGLNR